MVGSRVLPFVEKTIIVIKNIIEKIGDSFFHFLNNVARESIQVEESLPPKCDTMCPVAY